LTESPSTKPAQVGSRPDAGPTQLAALAALSLLAAVGAVPAATQPRPVLTRAAEVSRLSPEVAAGHLPVRLSGAIVYSDPAWSVLLLTDASGTAFIDQTAIATVPAQGAQIEVEGMTAAMGVFPGVVPTQLTTRAQGVPLPPVQARLHQLARRASVFEWVEVSGVVRALEERSGRAILGIQVGDRRLQVVVAEDGAGRADTLVDAEAVLTGVLEREGPSAHPPWLWVSSWEQVQVLVPAARRDGMPIRSVAEVIRLADGPLPAHRLRVRGHLAERRSEQYYIIEDPTGRIEARGLATGIARGTGLELRGFLERGPGGPRLVDNQEEVFQDPDVFDVPEAVEPELPTLRSLAEVRALTAAEARRGYPVDITGVVTFSATAGDMLFVQDETAAVYVSTLGAGLSLRAGQRVRLTGRTAPGSLAPVIVEPRVQQLLGTGLPTPRLVSGSRLATGQDDCQLVEIVGRIRRGVVGAGTAYLVFASEGQRFRARIVEGASRSELEPLIGATVRLRGVAGTSFDWRLRFAGVEILVPHIGEVRIDHPRPGQVPLRPLSDVFRPLPEAPVAPQVRVQGEVLLQDEQHGVFVRDPTGVLRVEAVEPPLLHPGDRVEAVGFAEPGDVPRLADAEIRIRGRGRAPDPVPVTVGRIMGEALSGELVRLSATLNDSVWTSSGLTLLLLGTDGVFEAELAGPHVEQSPLLEKLKRGSLLELTGVATTGAGGARGSSLLLLLRSAADIQVLATPSWWTAERVGVVAAMLLAAATLTLIWGGSLRRQVRRQTGEIQSHLEQARESEERYRQLFLDREKLVADLEAKNVELERFSYTVSHDLKSPLVTIKGFLGLVEKDVLEGRRDRLRDDIDRISRAIDKMEILLRDLLELSRVGRQMSPPEPVPFADIVADAIASVQGRLAETGARLEVPASFPTVLGDRSRLTQAVQNLLDNALKFAGDQPEPRIEVGTRGVDPEGRAILFVRDNGIGIEEPFREEVFGLFHKLNAKSEGTGIGLSLVKRIVEVHGGRVFVESEGKGRGATFVFTLPRPDACAETQASS
jgi:signal transduction histidine kinase